MTTPTRIYVKSVLPIAKSGKLKGVAHITGGGLIENPPRALAEGLTARVDWPAQDLPPVFDQLQRTGGVSDHELRRSFNCGIGPMLVVSPMHAPEVLEVLIQAGEEASFVGNSGRVTA